MSSPDLKTAQMAEVWMTANELGSFTTPELIAATGVSEPTVRHMVTRWVQHGFIRGDGKRREQRFAIVDKTPSAFGPRDKRIWSVMRRMGTFAAQDVAVWSTIEGDTVSEEDAGRYIRHLLDAGYLRVREKARLGVRPARYQLTKDTGPLPPVVKRIQALYDPNTAEITPNRRFREQEGLV